MINRRDFLATGSLLGTLGAGLNPLTALAQSDRARASSSTSGASATGASTSGASASGTPPPGASAANASTTGASVTGAPLIAMTPFGFIADFLEMMNAVSGGHFKRSGLDIQLLGGAGAAASLQQLLAGRVTFVRGTGLDTIKIAAQGQPVVSIATLYQTGYWYVMSAKSSPITSAEALRGRTIGIVSVKGSTENYLDLMLAKVGLPPESVRREVVGNSPGAFGLISQGRIDGFIASASVLATLRAKKLPVEAFDCDRYASIPAQCYLTTRATIQNEPVRVRQFVQALRASAEEMLSGDYFAILDRAAREFEITGLRDREELAIAFEIVKQSWLSTGRANLMRNRPEQWRGAAQAITAAGLADARMPDRMYTNEFVDPPARV